MKLFTGRNARFDRWAVRVADLMTRNPFSIRAEATIREAVSLLTAKRMTAAPVINAAGRPIGVLSLTDLMSGIRDQPLDDGVFFDLQVGDLMTPLVLLVDLDTPVNDVVCELLDCNIRQIYVADQDGTLVGVLGGAELLEGLRRRIETDENDEAESEPDDAESEPEASTAAAPAVAVA